MNISFFNNQVGTENVKLVCEWRISLEVFRFVR